MTRPTAQYRSRTKEVKRSDDTYVIDNQQGECEDVELKEGEEPVSGKFIPSLR